MSTLSAPLRDADEMLDPSVVKVVVDGRGDALYFSRGPIPHFRGKDVASLPHELRLLARKHVGLYAYRYRTLQRLAALPQAPLERAEGLEQLRALYHGIRIRVVPRAAAAAVAVDTPEDLERVRALLRPPTVKTPEEDACPPSTSS